MKFIDLFAGLGGFHKALAELGHECVFASEINRELQAVYENNFGLKPFGDIRAIIKTELDRIPDHDILCAGFPCQPFSKAGKQLGRDDQDHGGLFDNIVEVLGVRKPKYFILENVPFIAKHDNEATWNYMKEELERVGYQVDHRNYSPHQFGIPQHRLRIYIVGSLRELECKFDFSVVVAEMEPLTDLQTYLSGTTDIGRSLPEKNIRQLDLWQEFLDQLPRDVDLPGVPIWAMEFGATYPFEDKPPAKFNSTELGKYRGSFGVQLGDRRKADQMANIPRYSHGLRKFPEWKKHFIRTNRNFYAKYRNHLEKVTAKIAESEFFSWQKLEWNVDKTKRNIRDYLIQFRASGIRVKEANYFPSLVCTNTQTPIIGWEDRYISKYEASRLQALSGLELPQNDNAAFRALGNAVNAKIVRIIARHLLDTGSTEFQGDRNVVATCNSHSIGVGSFSSS
ncbi:MAG: DNA (cytosine-5-)-methyltransferase [Pyrinomonadaceae bacterium]